MARSTGCTIVRSHTWMAMVRGSGTVTVPSWLIGILAP